MNLITGNCLEVMRELPRASYDTILTDPPYATPATYYPTNLEGQRTRSWGDTSILRDWFVQIVSVMIPLLKPGGTVMVFCDSKSYAMFFPALYSVVNTPRALVWDKTSLGPGTPFQYQHELIIYGVVGKLNLIKDRDTRQSDVLRFKRVPPAKRRHPAEKPQELLRCLLKQTTPADGKVLDPFAGSCAVGKAADALGMDSDMIEINDGFFSEGSQ